MIRLYNSRTSTGNKATKNVRGNALRQTDHLTGPQNTAKTLGTTIFSRVSEHRNDRTEIAICFNLETQRQWPRSCLYHHPHLHLCCCLTICQRERRLQNSGVLHQLQGCGICC